MSASKNHRVYLCLGSNLGEKMNNLEEAAALIGDLCGSVLRRSGVYQSSSWGYYSKNDFYNQCLELETGLAPGDLLVQILEVERWMGRGRKGEGYADRIIDIDVLFYDKLILETEQLVVPHPRICERMFVLKPMLELAPDYEHPVYKQKISLLVEKCTDDSVVQRL